MQRLKLIRSNEEITEAILAHQNNYPDRIFTIPNTSISPSYFSTDIPIDNFTNTFEHHNIPLKQLQKNNLKSYSFDYIDEINSNARQNTFREKITQLESKNSTKMTQ